VKPQTEIDRYPLQPNSKFRSIDKLAHNDFIPAAVENRPSIYPQIQGEIQFKLLTHLAQDLRTPLTSVLGMASVLQQEIYGPLTGKQKDYLEIIHHSSQQLVTIVDEISQLGGCVGEAVGNENLQHQLTPKPVELEMLCQLALQNLEPLAQKKQQQIVLNPAGGSFAPKRICLLDKDNVRQIIYYLCLSLIHASAIDRQISIQLSNLTDGLQVQIATNDLQVMLGDRYLCDDLESFVPSSILQDSNQATEPTMISLGLSLSHTLAASHGGKIAVIANGRGYQVTLPLFAIVDGEVGNVP
jgi:signal transduction histidine kinase